MVEKFGFNLERPTRVEAVLAEDERTILCKKSVAGRGARLGGDEIACGVQHFEQYGKIWQGLRGWCVCSIRGIVQRNRRRGNLIKRNGSEAGFDDTGNEFSKRGEMRQIGTESFEKTSNGG